MAFEFGALVLGALCVQPFFWKSIKCLLFCCCPDGSLFRTDVARVPRKYVAVQPGAVQGSTTLVCRDGTPMVRNKAKHSGRPGRTAKSSTWTPKVCEIVAFYGSWAILLPTLGGFR